MLIIPSLLISASIATGSTLYWDNQDWTAHQEEANSILETSTYRYPYHPVYGNHDYRDFKNLHNVRNNALVIINNKRFRVKQRKIIDDNDMSILDGQTWLMTCVNENRSRFAVLLK